MLFGGTPVPPCAMPEDDDAPERPAGNDPSGEPAAAGAAPAIMAWAAREGTVGLPAFLAETCLSYCEFYELWQSGFVAFRNGRTQEGDGKEEGAFPECEPCCPDDLWLEFGEGQQQQDLADLLVFVRLWRTLRDSAAAAIRSRSCATSATCCSSSRAARSTPTSSGSSPRSRCCARSSGWSSPTRTARSRRARSTRTGRNCSHCGRGRPRLPGRGRCGSSSSGWNGTRNGTTGATGGHRSSSSCWRATSTRSPGWPASTRRRPPTPGTRCPPTRCASPRSSRRSTRPTSASESCCTCSPRTRTWTATTRSRCRSANDALDFPLGLPDEEREHALWRLRQDMLAVEVSEEEDEEWPWRRIDAALQKEFGFAPSDTLALAQHFFPHVLAQSGQQADPASALFVTPLAASATSASTWNDPPDGPFSYDPSAPQLSTRVPLTDRAVIETLTHAPDLERRRAAGRAGPVLRPACHAGGLRAAVRRLRDRAAAAGRRTSRAGTLRVLPAPVPAVPPAVRGHRASTCPGTWRRSLVSRWRTAMSWRRSSSGPWRRTRTRRSATGRTTRARCPG